LNIVFVSHCDFSGNSAMHVFALANELKSLGVDPIMAVPGDLGTLRNHGTPRFRVIHHDDALIEPLDFPDGRGPDLIHAWTPRELVRKVTEALAHEYSVPYLVHLEDNEEIIFTDELIGPSYSELSNLPVAILDRLVPNHRSHPLYYKRLMAGAAGVTVLMDTLLEFKPDHVPSLVFWAGFDPAFARAEPDPTLRRGLGITASNLMLVYNGNAHASNVDEIGSLVAAIATLRRLGYPVSLVKTGWNYVEIPYFDEGIAEGFIVDLGFLVRDKLPNLLACADVLVQPGPAGDFNDYRFPSKLPEFLVSGKPVLLPRTNIGRFLKDGLECVLLDEGHALDIAAKLEPLLRDPDRRKRIGASGREFALRELTWANSAARLRDFYEDTLGRHAASRSCSNSDVIECGSSAEPTGATPLRHRDEWWAKLIAFYLPQFHTIPENDTWWGEGFTEWTNVRRGTPSFPGHYQPQIPTDLGYYDLSDPGVIDRQAELARSHGIHGFCFYYYWFDGRRLLETPIENMLARGEPDFPFCVCWANENWTRRWDGSENEILMRQEYREGYAEQFIEELIPLMKDPRYIKVGEAPLLLVYRVDLLPDATLAARVWRRVCAHAGIPGPHLAAVQSFGVTDPRSFEFDAAVEFPPHTLHKLIDPRGCPGLSPDFAGYLEDYREVAAKQTEAPLPPYVRYRGVMPAWDNTPRRLKRAHICINSSPAAYGRWLGQAIAQTMTRLPVQEPLLFLNAWNEWAEGAYLEPDSRHGHDRLEATRQALCSGIAHYYKVRGFPVTDQMVESALIDRGVLGSQTRHRHQ
jgi:glycosyltransferase involved in cell wall biosynthesis